MDCLEIDKIAQKNKQRLAVKNVNLPHQNQIYVG